MPPFRRAFRLDLLPPIDDYDCHLRHDAAAFFALSPIFAFFADDAFLLLDFLRLRHYAAAFFAAIIATSFRFTLIS